MNRRLMSLCFAFPLVVVTACSSTPATAPEPEATTDAATQPEVVGDPQRNTITFEGEEVEYFVRLPRGFDRDKTYWLLVSVHGGAGNGLTNSMIIEVWEAVQEQGLDAIVVSPSFPLEASGANRFPVLGHGALLRQVLEDARNGIQAPTHPKILLQGYSRGAQFAHRFTLWNPELVHAAAPFGSGTWTTPDGRLLVDVVGEVGDPKSFLADPENGVDWPDTRAELFDPRVAEVAGLPAKEGAEEIPFLVMCGTLDPRLEVAEMFAQSLEDAGYMIETEWPVTPHSRYDSGELVGEHLPEFKKYSRRAVEFFLKVTSSE